MIAMLSAEKSQVSFYDLSGRLMAHEILLQNSRIPISAVTNVARQHTSSACQVHQSSQKNNGNKNNGASSKGNKKLFPNPCQICGLNNHQAKWCRKRYDTNTDKITTNSANVNASSNDWFPDTAASHHMTPDCLHLKSPRSTKGLTMLL
ncbi:hypothetical protein A4A49_54473 [Nicotiana attenuata]|uniref:Retrovirus-related pol polyprotein from transposon tnt 1-94 n=1 Tax=Nicotiana attenuata TaxID=49451 RepID=A0A314KTP0_NICAT|nr:hypothetical protein A4A49_54473 [Nicotiana attenuata]